MKVYRSTVVFLAMVGLAAGGVAQEPGKTPAKTEGGDPGVETHRAVASDALDFTKLIPPTLPRSVVFRQEGWNLWDPSMVQGDDGQFYLFYSRWSGTLGFDAWCTHAEIAWATSTNSTGPFTFQGVALPSRGVEYWDGHSVYNTCVVRISDKFYLYYTGNRGTTNWTPDRIPPSKEWWTHRNHQRIGVAVADSLRGPWRRSDKPLLDVGPGVGRDIINVPNLVVKPEGGYRLYYKTLAEGPHTSVVHYSADAESPLGPFVSYPKPIVDKNKLMPEVTKTFRFHIDDHFEWIQDGRYYAIVKDHDKPFLTAHGKSLLLFESPDGRDWKPSTNVLVKDFAVAWSDGGKTKYSRLEMPKLLFKNGRPSVLSLAAWQGSGESYIINIPLSVPHGQPTVRGGH